MCSHYGYIHDMRAEVRSCIILMQSGTLLANDPGFDCRQFWTLWSILITLPRLLSLTDSNNNGDDLLLFSDRWRCLISHQVGRWMTLYDCQSHYNRPAIDWRWSALSLAKVIDEAMTATIVEMCRSRKPKLCSCYNKRYTTILPSNTVLKN